MGLDFEYVSGQTPLDEDEKEGLLIETILSRGDLDEFERLNIEKAIEWTINNKFKSEIILSEDFIKSLHKRMLGDVWAWAGQFRKSDKNIGVDWSYIGIELRKLLDDAGYWIKNRTYGPDEIAIRFKHRLVKIHCFPNGNGRHSRMMADIIIESIFNEKVFDRRYSSMEQADATREEYIKAIKIADKGDIEALLKFARNMK
ncbi:MAG: mobile mystery protein B [Bacteroides sp.]|nr:mobile mystery protein B [Bacteroides sp.]